MIEITEENFLTKAKQKDEHALEYIIKEYGWVIKSIVSKHLYHLESYKEECINDVLLGIWQHIDRFDPEKSNFQNWVAGVARYKSLTYVRKYLKEIEYQSIDDIELIQEDTNIQEVLEADSRAYLEEMLSILNKEDQQLFCKIYLEDQEIADVSEELSMKKEVIYNRISRGKKKLKEIFFTRL